MYPPNIRAPKRTKQKLTEMKRKIVKKITEQIKTTKRYAKEEIQSIRIFVIFKDEFIIKKPDLSGRYYKCHSRCKPMKRQKMIQNSIFKTKN